MHTASNVPTEGVLMSPSTSTTPASTSTTSPERTEPVTRDEVIDRILDECAAAGIPLNWYNADDAADLIDQMTDIGQWFHETGSRRHFFSQSFLDRHHHVLDIIMPDNAIRKGQGFAPGSAYAGLNALCLSGTQLTFEHSKAHENARDHCVVEACVWVV